MTMIKKALHINPDADISPLVLMPGDPLRAKYIAEKFLNDAKLVTAVRNMYGFTGFYKGTKITVIGSGMGMPSMGIYSFELFHFFNVQKIIRIGTCGALSPDAKLNDIILADSAYSESNFAYAYNDYSKDIVEVSKELNKDILKASNELGLANIIHVGMLATVEVFGPYIDAQRIINRIPKEYKPLGEEMETFALCHVANVLGRKATAMVTITDSQFSSEVLSIEDREKSLNNMINIALEAIIK